MEEDSLLLSYSMCFGMYFHLTPDVASDFCKWMLNDSDKQAAYRLHHLFLQILSVRGTSRAHRPKPQQPKPNALLTVWLQSAERCCVSPRSSVLWQCWSQADFPPDGEGSGGGGGGGGCWLLKAPLHSLYMAALLQTYPNAKVIVTHRDPVETVISWTKFVLAHTNVRCAPSLGDMAGCSGGAVPLICMFDGGPPTGNGGRWRLGSDEDGRADPDCD